VEATGEVAVQSHEVTYFDLAPLLEELNDQFVTVNAKVINYRGPAAGGGELFFELIAGGGIIYLKGFIEALAAENATSIRQRILETLRKGKAQHRRNGFIPLRLRIGNIRFYFKEPLTLDEFTRRIALARDHVQSLSDDVLSDNGYGLFWNTEIQEWNVAVAGWGGDICPPDAG
jgi:hypothetical protein